MFPNLFNLAINLAIPEYLHGPLIQEKESQSLKYVTYTCYKLKPFISLKPLSLSKYLFYAIYVEFQYLQLSSWILS